MEKVPVKLRERSQSMRREPTPAEKALWQALRGGKLGVTFRRQVVRGNYIVDFACMSHCLVIEVDGDQHAENAYDRERDAWLKGEGYRVLRFSNREVLGSLQGVVETVLAALHDPCC